jgi:hypothetical protein
MMRTWGQRDQRGQREFWDWATINLFNTQEGDIHQKPFSLYTQEEVDLTYHPLGRGYCKVKIKLL